MRERVTAEVRPLFRERVPFEGGTVERVHDLVRRRTQVFERLAPFRRMESRSRRREPPPSEPSELDRALRVQVARALAPELAGRADLLETLDALLSFEAWNRMRTTQKLGARRVARLLERAVLALLGNPHDE